MAAINFFVVILVDFQYRLFFAPRTLNSMSSDYMASPLYISRILAVAFAPFRSADEDVVQNDEDYDSCEYRHA